MKKQIKKPMLTSYLQGEFEKLCADGWKCQREVRLLSPKLEKTFGYSPRADVLLERIDGSRRYWIEFEISRADPVANHAKFATGHLFEPQAFEDVFVAMVSPDVARGRRNLAANAINLMRCVGMNAFQTVLLPHKTGKEIKKLNTASIEHLNEQNLLIQDEIDRVFAVTQPITSVGSRRIHFVGDLTEVLLNLRQFNLNMATAEGRPLFGRRTVTYFVYDRVTKQFAPSKYCAYVAIPQITPETNSDLASRFHTEMTIAFYVTLSELHGIFDGRVARLHLQNQLAMSLLQSHDVPGLQSAFTAWTDKYRDHITVHPSGPQFLLPPTWF